MTKYPLTVMFTPYDWSVEKHPTMYGIDLEVDLLNHLETEFQKLDPTLSRFHIRGAMVDQLRTYMRSGEFSKEPVPLVINESTESMLESWKLIPFEFILADFLNMNARRNRLITTQG